MSDSLTIEGQNEKFEKMRLSDNVYELLAESEPHVEVVFFHGLQRKGSKAAHAFWRTWKMRDSEECWPETLLPQLLKREQTGFQYKARVLSVSYENRPDLSKDGKGTHASDDYLIVECLFQEVILRANVGQRKGVPVVLVGHDLGGILLKKFVMRVEEEADTLDGVRKAKLCTFLRNLTSVFFYATPQYGSDAFEKMAAQMNGKDANQMLRLMTVLHKDTGRINSSFAQYRSERNGPRITTNAIHALHVTNEGGYDVQVVPEGSARSDIDDFYSAGVNHFTVCQPEGTYTTEVIRLGRAIIKAIDGMKVEPSECRSRGVYPANGRTQHKRVRGNPGNHATR